MSLKASRLREEAHKQEVLNYIQYQVLQEQEDSRRGLFFFIALLSFFLEIDEFDAKLAQKPLSPKPPSDAVKRIDELEKIGVRKARQPDVEPYIYDLEVKPRFKPVFSIHFCYSFIFFEFLVPTINHSHSIRARRSTTQIQSFQQKVFPRLQIRAITR